MKSIFEIGSSKRVHKSDWRSEGIPFYRARDIEPLNSGLFKSELYIEKSFYEECKQKYGVPNIGDILITAVGTLGKTLVIKDNEPFYYKDGNIICLTNYAHLNPYFIELLFQTDFMNKQIHNDSGGTTVDTYTIIHANNTLIPFPPLFEQERIVQFWKTCLEQIISIAGSKQKLNLYSNLTKQKILESIFGANSSYKSYYPKNYLLGEILEYEQPGPYIVSSTDYNDEYKTPVLTPGKTFILGYTNEKEGIYHVDSKVIIFDDFTTASRLVNFDFKVKSSAMKILHSVDENKFNIDYMYYLLQTINVISDSHKRFWISEYASKRICIHTYEEQLKIVDIINSSFGLIESIIE